MVQPARPVDGDVRLPVVQLVGSICTQAHASRGVRRTAASRGWQPSRQRALAAPPRTDAACRAPPDKLAEAFNPSPPPPPFTAFCHAAGGPSQGRRSAPRPPPPRRPVRTDAACRVLPDELEEPVEDGAVVLYSPLQVAVPLGLLRAGGQARAGWCGGGDDGGGVGCVGRGGVCGRVARQTPRSARQEESSATSGSCTTWPSAGRQPRPGGWGWERSRQTQVTPPCLPFCVASPLATGLHLRRRVPQHVDELWGVEGGQLAVLGEARALRARRGGRRDGRGNRRRQRQATPAGANCLPSCPCCYIKASVQDLHCGLAEAATRCVPRWCRGATALLPSQALLLHSHTLACACAGRTPAPADASSPCAAASLGGQDHSSSRYSRLDREAGGEGERPGQGSGRRRPAPALAAGRRRGCLCASHAVIRATTENSAAYEGGHGRPSELSRPWQSGKPAQHPETHCRRNTRSCSCDRCPPSRGWRSRRARHGAAMLCGSGKHHGVLLLPLQVHRAVTARTKRPQEVHTQLPSQHGSTTLAWTSKESWQGPSISIKITIRDRASLEPRALATRSSSLTTCSEPTKRPLSERTIVQTPCGRTPSPCRPAEHASSQKQRAPLAAQWCARQTIWNMFKRPSTAAERNVAAHQALAGGVARRGRADDAVSNLPLPSAFCVLPAGPGARRSWGWA